MHDVRYVLTLDVTDRDTAIGHAAIRFERVAQGDLVLDFRGPGVSNVVIIIGTMFGPLIAGYLYDYTGSYRIGFDILAALAGIGSVFFYLSRRPDPPARYRDLATVEA